jgi:hypothetical protein
MRPICALTAGVTLVLVTAASGWAGEKSKVNGSAKDKELSTSFKKQFQWEEQVVGPKDKGVDHDKIAAMQEEGRREREAKKREQIAGHAPKAEHTHGVNDPASAKLPTMDIEKATPASQIHGANGSTGGTKKASYSPPKHDALDDLLAENSASNEGGSSGKSGLNRVIGKSSHTRKAAKAHRRRR